MLSEKERNSNFVRLQVSPLFRAIRHNIDRKSQLTKTLRFHSPEDQQNTLKRTAKTLQSFREITTKLPFTLSQTYQDVLCKMSKQGINSSKSAMNELGIANILTSNNAVNKDYVPSRRNSSYIRQIPFVIEKDAHSPRKEFETPLGSQGNKKSRKKEKRTLRKLILPVRRSYRRKSCCCTWCGPISALEYKTAHFDMRFRSKQRAFIRNSLNNSTQETRVQNSVKGLFGIIFFDDV